MADTLVELVTPAGQEPATRADVDGVLVALDARESRLTAALERGLREVVTSQTRTSVVSVLVTVVAMAGVAIGVAG